MNTQVKCRFCGKELNKDSDNVYQDKTRRGFYFCNDEHFIRYNQKTIKKTVNPNFPKEKEVKDARTELLDYVYLLYNKKIPTFVFKQIKDFATRKQKPLTYKGMELSLRYWVDTLGNPFDGDTGIGIVEYVYDEAEQFWKDKQRVARAAQEVKKDEVVHCVGARHTGLQQYLLRRKRDANE